MEPNEAPPLPKTTPSEPQRHEALSSSDPGQAKQTNDPPLSAYVVERRCGASPDTHDDMWADIATVELPQRSHRKTAIAAALKQAGLKGDPEDRFRILDADAAQEFALKAKPRPPVEDEFEVVTAD